MTKPRIAVCGLHIESSTFTPYLSSAKDFRITRGDALMGRYPWLNTEWAQAVQWLPVLHGGALPGGVVKRSDYLGWKNEILKNLAALTAEAALDGIFFDIHGAMSVEGEMDVEGDLITAIRDVVGPDPLVSASMDLHGNVSEALFNGCDLLTCYRMAPHEDAVESRERAARNLCERVLSGKGKPAKALVHVPILLPGEKTSTRIEPAKSLYGLIPEIEQTPGIIDAAIWVGFAWADQPRCKGAVVVYGDDENAVKTAALRLGQVFWDARNDFEFVAPVDTMAGCLSYAETAPTPFFISDSGDNPGAGGADDVTVALNHLLNWEPALSASKSVLCASIFDTAAAEACWHAGAGAILDLEIGGKIDTRAPGPQAVTAKVVALCDDPMGGHTAAVQILSATEQLLPPHTTAPIPTTTGAASLSDTSKSTASSTGITVIVTENRNQYCTREQYERLGLELEAFDVIVVKIGYLEPDLYEAAADWKMALTPGGVDQDLERLPYHHIDRPMFPFDKGMDDYQLQCLLKPATSK